MGCRYEQISHPSLQAPTFVLEGVIVDVRSRRALATLSRAASLASLLMLAMVGPTVPTQGQSAITDMGMAAYNRGDIATAYTLLRQAVEAGDPEGQVNLGYLYARGQGVPSDQAEALRFYRAAAAQGDSEGMNAIGYKYQFGTGVPANMSTAIGWYCRAVALGNPRALNNLAIVVSKGLGLPRDVDEARDLWKQAAGLGKANAMYNLAISYLGEQPAEGRLWLQQAAEKGQPDAQNLLRRGGYIGPLPPPVNESALMEAAPKGAVGHSKVCDGLVS